MLLGVIFGVILTSEANFLSASSIKIVTAWISLPGKLFLGLIRMIMIPLVFSSIILGINSETGGDGGLKRMGFRVAIYFVGTTFIAVILGILLAYWIEPGSFIGKDFIRNSVDMSDVSIPKASEMPGWNQIPSVIYSVFPQDPFVTIIQNEMLGVVIFTILIGVALTKIETELREPVLKILQAVMHVSMEIVNWAMKLAPVAVFGIMAHLVVNTGISLLTGLSLYLVNVLLGLICLLVFYQILLLIFTKREPLGFYKHIGEVQILAFSLSSSSAVMPLSLRTAKEKLKIREKVADFIIPIGATINMDGTALYQVVATVFLAQAYGIELTIFQLLFVIITTISASIGSPGTPGIGIVILATILAGVGIPAEGIGLILGVDRILDMCRTAVNVTGDLTACSVFEETID